MKRYNMYLYRIEYPGYFVKIPELTKHQYEQLMGLWLEGPNNDFLIEGCDDYDYKIEFEDSIIDVVSLADAIVMIVNNEFPREMLESPRVDLYLYSTKSLETCIKIPGISPDQAYFIARMHMSAVDGNVYTIDDRPWEDIPVEALSWRTIIVMTPEEWAGVA